MPPIIYHYMNERDESFIFYNDEQPSSFFFSPDSHIFFKIDKRGFVWLIMVQKDGMSIS